MSNFHDLDSSLVADISSLAHVAMTVDVHCTVRFEGHVIRLISVWFQGHGFDLKAIIATITINEL